MADGVNGTRALLLALLTVPAALACASAARDVPRSEEVREYLRIPSRAPALGEVIDTAAQQVWRSKAGRGSLGAIAIGERVVAIASVDRFVHLLDLRTGEPLWRYRGDAPYTAGPVIGHGRVFAASGSAEGRLTALDLRSGKRKWTTPVGDVAAPLVLRDTLLFGVTQGGRVFAVKTGNGRVLWRRSLSPIAAAPVVARGRVAVVTLTDSLFVLDAATGRPLVRAPLPAGSAAPPALAGDSAIVLASAGGGVMLVTLDSGRVVWHRRVSEPIFGGPVIAGDTAFVLSTGCTLHAIPLTAPSAADSASLGCATVATPVLVRGGVLVATVGGDVVLFDRSTGRRAWSRAVRGELRQPPAVRNGQIVVAPSIGDVVSFR